MFSEPTFCIGLGASYGTAKSGVGISSMGVLKPELIVKSSLPVVMAGLLGLYGLITAFILNSKSNNCHPFPNCNSESWAIVSKTEYSYYLAYKHLASGLSCGLTSLAAGLAIGIVGDAGVRANAQQEKIYVGMILVLIFAEALGLYGFIIAVVATSG